MQDAMTCSTLREICKINSTQEQLGVNGSLLHFYSNTATLNKSLLLLTVTCLFSRHMGLGGQT